jgi:hypothetical protein
MESYALGISHGYLNLLYMKRFFFISLGLLLALFVIGSTWYLSKFKVIPHNTVYKNGAAVNKLLLLKLNDRALTVKQFVKTNDYNNSICFLVDMSIESGRNRFFVYDLNKDSVLLTGLVTHGRCNEDWLIGRRYGNAVGCGCTSLGKYKIGNPYKGRFGLAYKLHGLDSTNNNAFKRYVVLHSHDCVPNHEVDPAPICQSDGCPTVSFSYLTKLAEIIDGSEKPVLLWVFE